MSLVLRLEHSCPWPQNGLSAVGLSLASDFFVCPWPWPRALCPRLHLWYLDPDKGSMTDAEMFDKRLLLFI